MAYATGLPELCRYRVLHGTFAQLELCLLVAIAVILSPVWYRLKPSLAWHGIARWAWIAVGALFLQLIVGASMRHLGAGLAIPTFPQAAPDGGWLPQTHSSLVDLNFTHTRIGALLVTVLVLTAAVQTWRRSGGASHLNRPAALIVVLLTTQVLMGIYVIWHVRPPLLTTLHVANGAALLATTVLLAVRSGRRGHKTQQLVHSPTVPHRQEVHA